MDKLEIGIWSSARPTEKDYEVLKQCGVTHAFIDENYCKRGTEEFLRLLEYCRRAGLKAYVFNYNSTQAFIADTADYSSFPAFEGLIFWDEPSADKFDEIAAAIPEFEARYPGKTFYVNLLPVYGILYDALDDNSYRDNVGAYEKYISDFCEKVLCKIHGRRILSVDYYALDIIHEENKVFLEGSFLKNLEIIAKYAEKYNAEPFLYIQTTSFGKWRREPTLADIYFQYYTALAFGVKGINLFTYTTPSGGEFSEKDVALIDRNGNPTEKYYFVQKVNADIKGVTEMLFSYKYAGTFVKTGVNCPEQHEKADIESLEYTLGGLEKIKILRSTESTVAGEFVKGGEYCYLIVNYTDPHRKLTNEIEISFGGEVTFSVMQRGKICEYCSEMFTLSLAAGEGALLKVRQCSGNDIF